MKKKIKKILFFVISLSAFSFSFQAKAGLLSSNGKKNLIGDMNKAGKTGSYNTSSTLSDVSATVVSAFLALLGIIFLIMILIGGYNWMVLAGNEDKVTKAKATLFRGVIGLFIIVAAYVITAFVFRALPGIVGRPT